MNKVILVGNLTRDPELTQTSNGISVCRFSLAVQRSYANASGEREADFLNIVTWRGLADNCAKYLSKGRRVAISGSIQTRSYDDKDGNKRYATDIVADDVEFLGGGDGGNNASNNANNAEAPKAKKGASELEPVEDEGLPF